MSGNDLTLVVVLGIVLRLGIPVVITIFLVFLMKKMDEHWQAEAESLPVYTPELKTGNLGCWEMKGCTEEMKSSCVAFAHPETPCWQVFLTDEGRLNEKCVGCGVFMQAPLLVKAPVRVRA